MKKMIAAPLLLAMSLVLFGCGDKGAKTTAAAKAPPSAAPATAKAPAYEAAYSKILDGAYEYVTTGSESKMVSDGMGGVIEVYNMHGAQEAKNLLGYSLLDVTGDNVPELLVGFINSKMGSGYYGNEIYAVYSMVDGKPQRLLEGWGRTSINLLPEEKFFYRSSGGAADYVYAKLRFASDGTSNFDYYCFTQGNGDGSVRIYRNRTGSNDPKTSQELKQTLDEFFESEAFADDSAHVQAVEFIPLGLYKKQGFKGLAQGSLACYFARDKRELAAMANKVTLAGAKRDEEIIFLPKKNVEGFKVLSLSLKNAGDDGTISYNTNEVFARDLLLANETLNVGYPRELGSIPNFGFAFKDDMGRLRSFSTSSSGYDGSLVINEF